MALTKSKIDKAITKFCNKNDIEDNYVDELFESSITEEPINGLKFDFEEENGGFEGGGDSCYKVFKVTELETGKEVYIKYDGYYSSYDGSTYDDGFYIADFDLVQIKKWKKKGSK